MARTGYTDIAAYYRQQIEDGALAPGDPMPSMRDVTEKFEVSITTANRAFRMLKSEGLTYAKSGVGTVVSTEPRTHVTGTGRLQRLERTGKPYAKGETSTDHQSMLLSCADPEIASQLGVELHDEIVIRRRVFMRGDTPTVFALSCIHMRAITVVPELLSNEPMPKFWQKIYSERSGEEITKSPERRGARLAADYELEALRVHAPKNAAVPVLVLNNVFHDSQGPLEVWEDVYAPGLWQVSEE